MGGPKGGPDGRESPTIEAEEAGECTKRRPWSSEEDEHLRHLVDIHGIKSWAHIATHLQMRNGKQCRERWRNHLRPQLNKGDWTPEEDVEIWERVQQMGTKWAQISETYMPSRTDNDIKNRWNSIIRKQQHPGGRDWEPEENEARAQILGSASRTQAGRRSTAAAGRAGGSAPGERKRKDAGPKSSVDDVEEEEDEAVDYEAANDSPSQGRKLFLSPATPPSPAAGPARELTPASSPPKLCPEGGRVPVEEPEPLGAPACKLFGTEEISAGLDADPFLAVATSVQSLSQICSPVIEGRAASRQAATPFQQATPPQQQHFWFDHELANSLSPILTPSLRHPRAQ